MKKKLINVVLALSIATMMIAGIYKSIDTFNQFELEVSRGNVIKATSIDKFGVNRDIQTNTDPEDIWEYGGIYNFSDVITVDPFLGDADIDRISSGSVNDTMEVIVFGLDENGLEVVQFITLQGQAPVSLTTPLWRVYRIVNNGTGNMQGETDENVDGTVYVYDDQATVLNGVPSPDSSVKAVMTSSNQTLMAIYTVPANKTGYLKKGIVGIDRAQSTGVAVFQYRSRRVGKVFNVSFEGSVSAGGSSYFKDERSFPDRIPPLTDIVIRISEVSSNDMGAFAAFDILLEEM